VHSIIGPNGAGKTTLFNCVTGVVRPDEGRVVLAGRDITGLGVVPRVRLGLVRTFQVSRVFGSVSARENVRLALQKTSLQGRLGLRLSRPVRRRIEERRDELLDEVGLGPASRDLPSGLLSHADRRAVEVAMALACEPALLCLDEPTAGIGIGEAEQMAELIGKLGERLAVLLIEHRMSLVQRVSRQVSVLSRGALLAQGTAGEIAGDPRVQDAYLGHGPAGGSAAAGSAAAGSAAVTRAAPTRRVVLPGEDLVLRDVHAYYGSSHVLHGVSRRRPRTRAVTTRSARSAAG
jgi:branched-chain amino acid transport system ATP-binding protein